MDSDNILLNYSESRCHILNISETFFHWLFVNKMNQGRENPKICLSPQYSEILDLLRNPSFKYSKTERLHIKLIFRNSI